MQSPRPLKTPWPERSRAAAQAIQKQTAARHPILCFLRIGYFSLSAAFFVSTLMQSYLLFGRIMIW